MFSRKVIIGSFLLNSTDDIIGCFSLSSRYDRLADKIKGWLLWILRVWDHWLIVIFHDFTFFVLIIEGFIFICSRVIVLIRALIPNLIWLWNFMFVAIFVLIFILILLDYVLVFLGLLIVWKRDSCICCSRTKDLLALVEYIHKLPHSIFASHVDFDRISRLAFDLNQIVKKPLPKMR